MFAMEPNKPHSERKRMITHVYSKSYIQNSPELNEIIRTMLSERLLPQMHKWAQTENPINIHKENKAFIMDITTAYLFGLGNGTNFIKDPQQKDLLRNFEFGMSGLFWIAEVPGITKWASRFGIKFISDGGFQSYQLKEDLCTYMCKGAKASLLSENANASHPTVYAQLRQKFEDAQISHEILDVTIAAEMLDHIQAGHGGTGITLTFLMCELSRNPRLIVKLMEEELATLGANFSAQALDGLPFLDALLMETMRLYPGSLGPFPRYVPEKGASLANFDIPPGTTVSASVYSLHRNSKVFPKPGEWHPERWAEATNESKKDMMKWFWVFGSGGRMCIGNHLAICSECSLLHTIFIHDADIAK
jgi:cytochrome P450